MQGVYLRTIDDWASRYIRCFDPHFCARSRSVDKERNSGKRDGEYLVITQLREGVDGVPVVSSAVSAEDPWVRSIVAL